MDKKLLYDMLLSFAVGDAFGMPTEFMTREDIKRKFKIVDRLLEPRESQNHSDLKKGSITDDTEQVIYLLKAYNENGVSIDSTVNALLSWVVESDAISKKYIGPSSLRALNSIKEGSDPYKTGLSGTTCGAIMRTLAPFIYAELNNFSENELINAVYKAIIPTHNTSQARETSIAYALSLKKALTSNSIKEVIDEAIKGCEIGYESAEWKNAAPRLKQRIEYISDLIDDTCFKSDDEFLDFLYYITGTGLESSEVASSVFALFIYTRGNVYKSIQLASSLGGDTDTIAALVAALSTAFSKAENIDEDIKKRVIEQNNLDFNKLLNW